MVTIAHEQVELRVFDEHFRVSRFVPFTDLRAQYSGDLSIDTLQFGCDNSELIAMFSQVRDNIPRFVRMTINGEVFDAAVTKVTVEHNSGGHHATVFCESNKKHAHRLLALSADALAEDSDTVAFDAPVAEVAEKLLGAAAVRTGLPIFVEREIDGDRVQVEARPDQTVADVVGDALAGSNVFCEVRMILPGDMIPGSAQVRSYSGRMEHDFQLSMHKQRGWWPDAHVNERLQVGTVETTAVRVPPAYRLGVASTDVNGVACKSKAGLVWVPFQIRSESLGAYWSSDADGQEVKGARVATREELEKRVKESERLRFFGCFVTQWAAGAFAAGRDLGALDDAIKQNAVFRVNGARLRSRGEVTSLIGANAAFAWREGTRWIIATKEEFEREADRRAGKNEQVMQFPAVLFRFFSERDRREIVFSSAPGGGLDSWESSLSAPDAAMLVAGGQLDQLTIEQLAKSGVSSAAGVMGRDAVGARSSSAAGVLRDGETLDVSVQPTATVQGTDVSFSAAGQLVDVRRSGAFFFREAFHSFSSSAADRVHEILRAWAELQGSTELSLSAVVSRNAVFGGDVVERVGRRKRVVLGWRVGDRVSLVDGSTRVSEVVSGVRVEVRAGGACDVLPVFGRPDAGVLGSLSKRLKSVEKRADRALLASQRRAPREEVAEVAESVVEVPLAEVRQQVDDARAVAAQASADVVAAKKGVDAAQGRLVGLGARVDSAVKNLDRVASDVWQVDQRAAARVEKMEKALEGLYPVDGAGSLIVVKPDTLEPYWWLERGEANPGSWDKNDGFYKGKMFTLYKNPQKGNAYEQLQRHWVKVQTDRDYYWSVWLRVDNPSSVAITLAANGTNAGGVSSPIITESVVMDTNPDVHLVPGPWGVIVNVTTAKKWVHCTGRFRFQEGVQYASLRAMEWSWGSSDGTAQAVGDIAIHPLLTDPSDVQKVITDANAKITEQINTNKSVVEKSVAEATDKITALQNGIPLGGSLIAYSSKKEYEGQPLWFEAAPGGMAKDYAERYSNWSFPDGHQWRTGNPRGRQVTHQPTKKLIKVQPGVDYTFKLWTQATSYGSILRIEFRNQDDKLCVKSGGLRWDGKPEATSCPVNDLWVPMERKHWETKTLRFTEDTREVYLDKIWFNHPSAKETNQWIAGIECYPSVVDQAMIDRLQNDAIMANTKVGASNTSAIQLLRDVAANQSKWNAAQSVINAKQSVWNSNVEEFKAFTLQFAKDQAAWNKTQQLVNEKQSVWNAAVTRSQQAQDTLNAKQGAWNKATTDAVNANSRISSEVDKRIRVFELQNQLTGVQLQMSELIRDEQVKRLQDNAELLERMKPAVFVIDEHAQNTSYNFSPRETFSLGNPGVLLELDSTDSTLVVNKLRVKSTYHLAGSPVSTPFKGQVVLIGREKSRLSGIGIPGMGGDTLKVASQHFSTKTRELTLETTGSFAGCIVFVTTDSPYSWKDLKDTTLENKKKQLQQQANSLLSQIKQLSQQR
ncbi:hypothetical protein QP222_05705 [Corynebacterium pyruviciproducens]|uniref:hypothetical protein n=1 Tax=Corynebacterium pyruviciproducens TaxID=598660 RepID=UPI00254EE956|nr:hypothetical protein [Corynebacterium pyruviciproducens]MDK6565904.1 hypothetical protein [Corynebacterium pyruviciproducens]